MQIIVTWSNGMTSELEVEVPAGATPLRTSFAASRPDTALHQREDDRWECYSIKPGGQLLGYCLAPEMVMMTKLGHPMAGLCWADIWNKPENHTLATAISRCPWIKEDDWEQDRLKRLVHAGKFHFHGHASDQEAADCYHEFLHDFDEKEPV